MIRRHSAKFLSIGAAAALAFGAAAAVEAQTTPTSATDTTTAVSQKRIHVTKEQGTFDTTTSTGAVTSPSDTTTTRTDTTTSPGMLNTDTTRAMDTTVTDTATGNVTTGVSSDTTTRQGITGINDTTVRADTTMRDTSRTDTSTTMTTDTLMRDTTTTPNTTVRTDTSTVRTDTSTGEVVTRPTTEPDTIGMYPSSSRYGRLGRGFWIGVGGGATVPVGNLHNNGGYDTGWNITVPIGWQSASTPWGLRLDLSYDRLNGSTIGAAPVSVTVSDAKVWSGSLDLTLQFPFGSSGSSFYLMGGGGVHHFTGIGTLNGASFPGGSPLASSTDGKLTRAGVNGGAGLNFGFGRAKLFLESRYVSVFTKGKNSNYVPIILGVRLF